MFVRVNNLAEFEKALHSIDDVPVAVDLLTYVDKSNFTNKGYLYVTSDKKTTFILDIDMFNKDFGYYVCRKMIISNYSFSPDYYGRNQLNINFEFVESDIFPSLLTYTKNGKLYNQVWYSVGNKTLRSIYNELDYISEQSYLFDQIVSFHKSLKTYDNELFELIYMVNDKMIDYKDIRDVFSHLPALNTIKDTNLNCFLTSEEQTILAMTFI